MADLNKKALIEIIAEEKGYTKKEAGEIVELVIDTMVGTLQKGDTVDLPGFGKFTVKARDARTGINPLTKEKIEFVVNMMNELLGAWRTASNSVANAPANTSLRESTLDITG